MVRLTSFYKDQAACLRAHPGGSHPVPGPRRAAEVPAGRSRLWGSSPLPQNTDRCSTETAEFHPQGTAEMVLAWKLWGAGVIILFSARGEAPSGSGGAPAGEEGPLMGLPDKLATEHTKGHPMSWLCLWWFHIDRCQRTSAQNKNFALNIA